MVVGLSRPGALRRFSRSCRKNWRDRRCRLRARLTSLLAAGAAANMKLFQKATHEKMGTFGGCGCCGCCGCFDRLLTVRLCRHTSAMQPCTVHESTGPVPVHRPLLPAQSDASKMISSMITFSPVNDSLITCPRPRK